MYIRVYIYIYMYIRVYIYIYIYICIIYNVRYSRARKKDCIARLGVINDTLSGRIIFITTNSWLCTLAHILRVADKGRCYTARPWRINLLIKAIPLTPAGATTHLIRHRESNSGRPYSGSSSFSNLIRAYTSFARKTERAGCDIAPLTICRDVIELSWSEVFCIHVINYKRCFGNTIPQDCAIRIRRIRRRIFR
jgi:hypothetical protein